MQAFDTQRLHVRPLTEDDEALYCSLYTDPEVMRHIAAPMTLEVAQRSFRAACELQSPLPQRWIISERDADSDIGLLGLFADGDTAEIGVVLLSSKQGQGFSAEAIKATADRVFAAAALRLLWTRHAPDNGLAIGLMHKLGFVCEHRDGTQHTQLRWQLSRERWLSHRGNGRGVAISRGDG